jgi:hypothetical protein
LVADKHGGRQVLADGRRLGRPASTINSILNQSPLKLQQIFSRISLSG